MAPLRLPHQKNASQLMAPASFKQNKTFAHSRRSVGRRVALPAVMLTSSQSSVASITAGYSKDTLRVKSIIDQNRILQVSPKNSALDEYTVKNIKELHPVCILYNNVYRDLRP